ncbi:MAG TPA: ABC transporter ATP-binding protein [Geminicoccaceae bacterium]|nr:ABC transporter ATP-binding protein [Geminicoccaceae bacterium]
MTDREAPVLQVRGLSVRYERDAGPVPVLEGVDLTVRAGQSHGIVGESGSGKSVLLRAVLRLLEPPWRVTAGQVLLRGEDLLREPEHRLERVRGRVIALTLSNPRQHLNPVMAVGRQIATVIRKHQSVSKPAATRQAIDLLRAVGIPDPAHRYHAYPHELSGGMCQRIIIAMGIANAPELILADEPTSGLDVTISIQILDLMKQSVERLHSALLLVSRDLGVIANYCQRVAVMYAGEVVEEADVLAFFDRPVHPYSRHLVRAAEAARDAGAGGAAAAPARGASARAATGCRYAARCPVALDACRERPIPLEAVRGGHPVRCIRQREILAGELRP